MPHGAQGSVMCLFFESMPKELADKVVPPERTTMLLRVSRSLCPHIQRLRPSASIQITPRQHARHVLLKLESMLETAPCTISSLDMTKLSGSIQTQALASVLSRCVALRRLDLPPNFCAQDAADRLAAVLRALTSLQHVGMVGKDLDLVRGKSLACVLPNVVRCTRLELRFHQITALGAENFAAGLGTCGALTELVLDHCRLRGGGIQHLAAAIAQCTGLTKLSLSTTAIRDEAATTLAPAFCALTALRYLNLASNYFEERGVTRLAAGLVHCREFEHLNLSSNECGRGGLAALEPLFRQCSRLRTLGLASTEMGSFGAASLDRSLPASCPLRQLNLRNNFADAGGCQKIASVIARCGELAELRLSCNAFGDAGGQSLARGLGACSSLVRLYLNHCYLTSVGIEHVAHFFCLCHLSLGYILQRSRMERANGLVGRKQFAALLGDIIFVLGFLDGLLHISQAREHLLQEH